MSRIDTSFAKIYKNILFELSHNYQFLSSPRGFKIKEILNYQFTLENPLSCIYTNNRRSSPENYIVAELLYYFRGKNDLAIANHASLWSSIANEDGTINSAYGYMVFNRDKEMSQWMWVFTCLLKDKDSRQAMMYYGTPDYQRENNKDFPCTGYQNFQIRENKLYSSIRMRSSDVITGLSADIVWFSSLMIQVYLNLKPFYPDLEIGSLTFSADSLHLYEKHFILSSEMLQDEFKPNIFVSRKLINSAGKPLENFDELIQLPKEEMIYSLLK